MDVNNSDKSESQQIIIQTSNYNVTVIPVEFNRSRVYSSQNSDYLAEPYSRTHDDYSQTDELSSSQNALYSVSQRLPPVSTSFSNLCSSESSYVSEQINYQNIKPEWERERTVSTSDSTKDGSSADDKQNSESTTASVQASLTSASNPSTSSSTEPFQGPVIPTSVYLHSRTAVIMEVEDTPSATTELLCQAIINSDELGLNKILAAQIFTLQKWRSLVEQYSHASYNRQQRDEPKIMFQRNVFFPQHLEEKIKEHKILELLYEEARSNILKGRYPCEVIHYIMLGGIQARIELGPYNPLKKFNLDMVADQFKKLRGSTIVGTVQEDSKLCYEQKIDEKIFGILLVFAFLWVVLLGLRFEEFSWEYARPSKEGDPNCQPCLFVQFMVVENGARVSKILQVFSRQASLMDSLIVYFVNQLKSKSNDETDKPLDNQVNNDNETHSSLIMTTVHSTTLPSLSNKLSRLTLATFDEDGHCIGQMGSWSVSY
nr:unnamed protein product [Callosobruchus analis]